jgi:hypothetical protein
LNPTDSSDSRSFKTDTKARARDFQQSLINVDSDDVPGDLGNLQGAEALVSGVRVRFLSVGPTLCEANAG